MMLRAYPAACALLASLALAGTAFAGEPVTVTLQQPVPAKAKLIAGGVMFQCRDAVCIAAKPASRTYAAATCRDIAKAFGPVAAFGNGIEAFDDQKLSRCNAAVAFPEAQIAKR